MEQGGDEIIEFSYKSSSVYIVRLYIVYCVLYFFVNHMYHIYHHIMYVHVTKYIYICIHTPGTQVLKKTALDQRLQIPLNL